MSKGATIHRLFAANDVTDDLSWDIEMWGVEDIDTAYMVYVTLNRDTAVDWCVINGYHIVDIDEMYRLTNNRWTRKETTWAPPSPSARRG